MKKIKGKNLAALTVLSLLVISMLTSAAMPAASGEEGPARVLTAAQEPEESETVSPSQEPEPSETASPSQEPEPSETASPSQESEPSETVSPSQEPEPSETVSPSQEPEPSEIVSPSQEPEPSETPEPSPEPEESAPLRTSPVAMVTQTSGFHSAYLSGTNGMFYPDRVVTRAELAQLLSGFVSELPKGGAVLYDVPNGSAELVAIQKMLGLGMMTAPNGFFRPSDQATRADCAYALAALLPYGTQQTKSFADVPAGHWAHDAIAKAGGAGLFSADGSGNFRPDEGLKRWEMAAAFNRLLGRSADQVFVSQMPAFTFFSDVPASHPGYWDVLEATVPHAYAAANGGESWMWADVRMQTDGLFRINRRLYWVSNGEFVRNQSNGYLYFDSYGRYTTGNANLDVRLNNIIESYTNSSMTRDEKLRALFNYCRDNYTYLKRPLISKGQTGWEPDYALFFLNNGRGNCYCFSATYCLLCRNLGLQAYTVVGSALNSPHGWVEIELDGAVYLFDTQLEWRYLHDWGRTGYNFFMQPYYSTTVAYTR